ncbi:ribonuclease H-like domain-containing protein [Tanacetum coccineum]
MRLTMSMDDLYNNLKVYEPEVKWTSSSNTSTQNMAFVSSNNSGSTNEAVNTAHEVSAASTQANAANPINVDNLSDVVICAFFSSQPNNPQLANEDLQQLHPDDLEEIDLRWQMAIKLKKKCASGDNYLQCFDLCERVLVVTTGHVHQAEDMRDQQIMHSWPTHLQVLSANYLEQIDTDDLEEMDLKWQVECYNCHRRGHFARECRAPRNQGNRNGDAPRRIVPVETPANALVVQDGIGGYDWSFQAEEGITNFALMAYTSQGSSSSSSSDSEREALNKSNLEIIGYQMGLESLEARIVVHEKNEVVYEEDIAFLNAKDKTGLGYDSQMNESEVVHSVFNSRESDVDDSPVNDRFKIGEGFHAVPPPYTGNYMPSRPDLSFVGLDDSVYKTKVSETETSISKTSKDIVEKPKTVRPSAPIIED